MDIDYCGISDSGNDIVSFTNLLDTYDPTGYLSIYAQMDGPQGPSWFPIAECENYGMGFGLVRDRGNIQFNTFDIYEGIDGCLVGPAESGETVVAHACNLSCEWRIDDLTEASTVLMAYIDDAWHIVKVVNASQVAIFDKDCGCCQVGPYYLSAKITGGCPEYQDLPSFLLRPTRYDGGEWVGDSPSGESCPSIHVVLTCDSDGSAVLEDIDDWSITACDTSGGISFLDCGNPTGELPTYTGTGTSFSYAPFHLIADFVSLTGCCDCSGLTIEIRGTDRHYSQDCYTDEFLEDVVVEACGMDSLASGDSIIMARMPPDVTGVSESGNVEWYALSACNNLRTCDVFCESPPEDPLNCCGVPCTGWPTTLNMTIEVLDGDCSPCTESYLLTKQACEVNTEYSSSPTGITCTDVIDAPFILGFVYLSCLSQSGICAPFESGQDPIFSLTDDSSNDYTLDMETACCDPFYLEFTASTQNCQPLMGNIDGNIRITITE